MEDNKSSKSRNHFRRMVNSFNKDCLIQFINSDKNDFIKLPPIYALIDLTWNCNYDCIGCIDTKAKDGEDVVFKKVFNDPLKYDTEAFKGKFLSKKIISNTINYVKKYNLRGIQLMGGETLLHPEIDEILCELADNNIPIEMVSNGSFIIDHIPALSKALSVNESYLRVSINAWSKYGERVGWDIKSSELLDKVISGIKLLINELPAEYKESVFVTTVAFKDALDDLEELVINLSKIGLKRMVIIRERNSESKGFLKEQEAVKDQVIEIVEKIKSNNPNNLFEIGIADNIVVEPIEQKKEYSPCPAVFLKAFLGADGFFYSCTDHRGSKNARLVNIHDYGDDFEKAWHSQNRVNKALAWVPKKCCNDLVCQRFDGNICISAFRQVYDTWTF